MSKGKYEYWLSPDGLTLLAAWARDGLTDEQIAQKCGICRDTLYSWKARFPDISDALKKGKEIADIEVENALYRRATGYDVTETRVEVSDKDGRKRVQITRHILPDVGAIALWLKNRRPDKWRDKPETAAVMLPDLEKDPLSAALEDTEC